MGYKFNKEILYDAETNYFNGMTDGPDTDHIWLGLIDSFYSNFLSKRTIDTLDEVSQSCNFSNPGRLGFDGEYFLGLTRSNDLEKFQEDGTVVSTILNNGNWGNPIIGIAYANGLIHLLWNEDNETTSLPRSIISAIDSDGDLVKQIVTEDEVEIVTLFAESGNLYGYNYQGQVVQVFDDGSITNFYQPVEQPQDIVSINGIHYHKVVGNRMLEYIDVPYETIEVEFESSYQIYNSVTAEFESSYCLYNTIGKEYESSYSIFNTSMKEFESSFAVYNTLTKDFESAYTVYNVMQREFESSYKISGSEVYEIFSSFLSHWIYDLECGSDMDKLLMLMASPLQDALETIREGSKMLRVLEANGCWCDLNAKNAGVIRDGKNDDELIAATVVGGSGKSQNATFDTITESLAAALNLSVEEVKLFETKARHLAVEIHTDKNIAVEVRNVLLKVKAAGIIIDDIVKLNGKDLILSSGEVVDSPVHGLSNDPEAEIGLLSEVIG